MLWEASGLRSLAMWRRFCFALFSDKHVIDLECIYTRSRLLA